MRVRFYVFPAFTLIELLVVISIIGMLAGLLLPAIQSARESGRRTTCINAQRNIATALLQYESSAGAFPGWRNKATVGGTDATVSWVMKILPLIEEPDLYKEIMAGAIPATLTIPKIPILRCSSAGITSSESPARITYVVNGGAVDDFWPVTDPVTYDENAYNGVFLDTKQFPNIRTSIDELSKLDGTSRTLLLSENINAGFWIASDDFTTSDCNRNGTTGAPDTAEGGLAFCWGQTYPGNDYDAGEEPEYGGFNSSSCSLGGNEDMRRPRWINICVDTNFGDNWYPSARPSAYHPGVVVSVFCDGHVQPINDSIDELVFVQIMTGSDKKSSAKNKIGTLPQPVVTEL